MPKTKKKGCARNKIWAQLCKFYFRLSTSENSGLLGTSWAKVVKSSNCCGLKSGRTILKKCQFCEKYAIPVKIKEKSTENVRFLCFLVWVTRLELAASTTPNWKNMEISPAIVDYSMLSSAICRFYGLFKRYRRASKMYILVHSFKGYTLKVCTKKLCTSRFCRTSFQL